MRHRLPLSGPAVSSNEVAWERARQVLPWPAVGIADTGHGNEALLFAVELAEAAHALGIPVRASLLDFTREPQLSPHWAERFARVATGRSIRVDDSFRADHPRDALQLWVGIPALVALAPALSVLLGAERQLLEWPSALRGLAASVVLALPGAGPGVARALTEELNRRGFLPAGSQSVR